MKSPPPTTPRPPPPQKNNYEYKYYFLKKDIELIVRQFPNEFIDPFVYFLC